MADLVLPSRAVSAIGRNQVVGSLAVTGAAVLWGLWPVWVRHAGNGPQAATMALLLAGALGLPYVLYHFRRRPARAWLVLGALAVSNATNSWFYARGLDDGSVAAAALSHYLAPVLVALVAPRILGEPRHPHTPWALGLALVGTAILVGAGGLGDATAVRTGAIYGGASALFYATSVILAKRLGPSFTDVEMIVYTALVGGLLLLPVTGVGPPWWPAVTAGLFSTLAAGALYYLGLRRLPAERAGVLTYLEPLVAVLVGWLVLAEQPSPLAALGGALVLAGGVLVVRAPGISMETR